MHPVFYILIHSVSILFFSANTESRSGLKTALKMMDLNEDKVISCEEFKQVRNENLVLQ